MKQYKKAFIAVLVILLPSLANAQDTKGLTITTEIDSVYVFGFDLKFYKTEDMLSKLYLYLNE